MSGRSKCAFADYVALYFLNSCFDLMFDRSITNFLFRYVLLVIC